MTLLTRACLRATAKTGTAAEAAAGPESPRLFERWDRRYFVVESGSSHLRYYKSEADYASGKAPHGTLDCRDAAIYLTEIVKGGLLTEGGHRFTILTAERELKLKAADVRATPRSKWQS